MDINKPWGYWVSIFLNCTPIISDSTQRIFPPSDHGGIPSILFGILYYSDKSKLSSFGSVKGWPVLAHALPLPCSIHNGRGCGRVCLIGWLPYGGIHESVILCILTFSRLRRNRTIKGSHIGLILSATYIIVAWKRYPNQ